MDNGEEGVLFVEQRRLGGEAVDLNVVRLSHGEAPRSLGPRQTRVAGLSFLRASVYHLAVC